MLMLILAAIAAVVLFYYFYIKPYDYWTNKGVKQGKPVWILGDNWRAIFKRQSFAGLVISAYNQCPGTRYSGMYEFSSPTLVVKDPDLIKQLTVKDFDHFTDHRPFHLGEIDPLWSNNIFALKGQKWRDMRTILTPSFTSSKMKAIFVLMTECAENFVEHFLKKDEDVITLEVMDVFIRYTTDVIATTAFGVNVDSLKYPNNEFYMVGKEATNFIGFWKNMKAFGYFLFPKLYSVLKVKMFSKAIRNFFLNLIEETLRIREEQDIVRPDMINLLMEARKGKFKNDENGIADAGFSTAQESEILKSNTPREITNMEIASQAMFFYFAAFDSVARLLSFISYELALHPEIQDRLREEVRTTLEECGGKLTYEGLLKMKYMDMVISEGLRKWPPALVVDRVCVKPYTIEPTRPDEKRVSLKKGDKLFLPIFGIHRDPQYFPDPEKFDPERFSDDNKENIKPYTYNPFGFGPRNCISSRFALLEAKTVLFHTLAQFKLVPVKETPIPLKLWKQSFNPVAEGGFWLGLKRIKE